MLDVIAKIGGLAAGLALAFGACLVPAARCSYEIDTLERVNGVELSCSDRLNYGFMLCGCRSCCSNPKLDELEEKTQETVKKVNDPVGQVAKEIDLTEMLPEAKAENKP